MFVLQWMRQRKRKWTCVGALQVYVWWLIPCLVISSWSHSIVYDSWKLLPDSFLCFNKLKRHLVVTLIAFIYEFLFITKVSTHSIFKHIIQTFQIVFWYVELVSCNFLNGPLTLAHLPVWFFKMFLCEDYSLICNHYLHLVGDIHALFEHIIWYLKILCVLLSFSSWGLLCI